MQNVGNHWTNIEKTIIVDKTNMQKIRGEILDVLGMSQKGGGIRSWQTRLLCDHQELRLGANDPP